MVEAEEEYMEQLEVLVSCFLRPFKMAASSKKPPCSHEDVNSIFLNTETVMFLHQIFLKGLTSRMESWPTLVLGEPKIHPRWTNVKGLMFDRRSFWHASTHAIHIPRVCEEPPLQPAGPHRMQTEPTVCVSLGEAGKQAGMSRTEPGNPFDVPNAPSNKNFLQQTI